MATLYRTRTMGDQSIRNFPQWSNNASEIDMRKLAAFRRTQSLDEQQVQLDCFRCEDEMEEKRSPDSAPQSSLSTFDEKLEKNPQKLTTFPEPGKFNLMNKLNLLGKNATEQGVRSNVSFDNKSMYWMPDKVCKACYDCSTPFSFFRRKHHCRLCGHIFCYECSSKTVNGLDHGFIGGPIRACDFCYAIIEDNSKSKKKMELDSEAQIANRKKLFMLPSSKSVENITVDLKMPISPTNSIDSKMNEESQLYSFGESQDNESRSRTTSPCSSESSIRSSPLSPLVIHKVPADIEKTDDDATRRPSLELSLALENFNHYLEYEKSRKKSPSKFAYIKPSNSMNDDLLQLRNKLMTLYDVQLLTYVKKLMSSFPSISSTRLEVDELCEHLVIHCSNAAQSVDPAVHSTSLSDGIDIRPYIRIKTIASPISRYAMESIAGGFICRKNVARKKMAKKLIRPNLLLLGGMGIEYERNRACVKMSSLDILLEQEKKYMEIVASKLIAILCPNDVLVVEGSVSSHALNLLQAHGIIVILGIKSSILKTIAQITGGQILSSTDHVDKMDPKTILGKCETLEIVYIKTKQKSINEEKLEIIKNEAYIFLRGCNPATGNTILIRGPNKEYLTLLKKIVMDIVYVAYNMYLETNILVDMAILPPSHLVQLIKSRNGFVLNDSFSVSRCWLRTVHNTLQEYAQCSYSAIEEVSMYSDHDFALGKFLLTECFVYSSPCKRRKCLNSCNSSQHVQIFNHNKRRLIISTELIPDDDDKITECESNDILMWRYCKKCAAVVSHFSSMSAPTWKLSFFKFLQILLTMDTLKNSNTKYCCAHERTVDSLFFFGHLNQVAKFETLEVQLWRFHAPIVALNEKNNENSIRIKAKKLKELMRFVCQLFIVKTKEVTNIWNQEVLEINSGNAKPGDDETNKVISEVYLLQKQIEAMQEDTLEKELEAISEGNAFNIQQYQALNMYQKSLYLCCMDWNSTLHKIHENCQDIKNRSVQGILDKTISMVGINNMNETARSLVTSMLGQVNKKKSGEQIESEAIVESEEISILLNETMKGINSSGAEEQRDINSNNNSLWSRLEDLKHAINGSNKIESFQVKLPQELFMGHPLLQTGLNDSVLFVYENEPCSVIAYSLNSTFYARRIEELSIAKNNWLEELQSIEKTHIKHKFTEDKCVPVFNRSDMCNKNGVACKIVCQSFFACQFRALRKTMYEGKENFFVNSLSFSSRWETSGGKSGANFFKTLDGNFIVKQISRTELQSFLEVAPAYFTYLSGHFGGDKRASILSKVLGLYQVSYTNLSTGEKNVRQICILENVFSSACESGSLARKFDLKGSSRNRYIPTDTINGDNNEKNLSTSSEEVLLDGNFLEYTNGFPVAFDEASFKYLMDAIRNDTDFFCKTNLIDYSMLIGFDDENGEVFIGIIDYLRQFDFMKRMESVGKSVQMIAGHAAPTIIQPSQYSKRFIEAISTYFMAVPAKAEQNLC